MTRRERNVVSLTDVRLPELRAEIAYLRERLQNVTDIFSENEQSFKIIADIALTIQECETIEELDGVVGGAMIEQSADHACFYVKQPELSKTAVKHIRQLSALTPTISDPLSRLVSTKCEACRAETYKDLLNIEVADPASIAQIPVSHRSLSGVLIIGAEDPDFFSKDVGTLYLDFVGATLARVAYRIFAVGSVQPLNRRSRQSAP